MKIRELFSAEDVRELSREDCAALLLELDRLISTKAGVPLSEIPLNASVHLQVARSKARRMAEQRTSRSRRH